MGSPQWYAISLKEVEHQRTYMDDLFANDKEKCWNAVM